MTIQDAVTDVTDAAVASVKALDWVSHDLHFRRYVWRAQRTGTFPRENTAQTQTLRQSGQLIVTWVGGGRYRNTASI